MHFRLLGCSYEGQNRTERSIETDKVSSIRASYRSCKIRNRVLENILPEVKDQLEIDFDAVQVYPGPQTRESADIELYKSGSLIIRLNVKTCMSGDLRATVNKLRSSIRVGENGLIIAFVVFEKEKSADLKMIIIYIPRVTIIGASPNEIVE